jgi:hypothetical protein
MPAFKHKTNKNIVLDEKSIITLDSKHKEIENTFEKDKNDTLPELRGQKKHFTKLLDSNTYSIEQKLEISDKIKDISDKIK